MTCPTCGKEAVFTERWESHLNGGDTMWLECDECGSRTDDEELAKVNQEEETCD